MRADQRRVRRGRLGVCLTLALGVLLAMPAPVAAQTERGNPPGEWRYQSGDAWGTRYSPLTQINASKPRRPRIGMGLAGRQLQPPCLLPVALDAELHRRHPL